MSMETSQQSTLPLERPGLFKRAVTHCMLVVFTITTVAPSAPAFANGPGFFAALQSPGATSSSAADDDATRYAAFFQRVRDEAGAIAGKPDKFGRLPDAARQDTARERLGDLLEEMEDIQSSIQVDFEEIGELVRSKKLPKSIRARQDTAISTINGEFEAMRRDIRQVRAERDVKKRKSLAEGLYRRLDVNRFERPQQEFNPFELPNSTLRPDKTTAPRITEEAFISAGLVGNPLRRVAQASGYNIASLPGASDPAFLAATDEAVLTADIRAKANELGNEPVQIYEWVRNNVQWAPTWGAIQDASHTLSSARGNAFDIASLTIALLRAAGYPARYVHGTIDVPEDAFRNWSGGFASINAAMEFAASGGIPIGPVTSAGKITKVRMEHIWVEAAIDFHPSHGTRNREADSWVALDPSFKQLGLLPGVDVQQISGIDADAVIAAERGTGTINRAESWISGFDASVLENAQAEAGSAVLSHVQQSLPNASIGDVLGGREIVAVSVRSLPSGLPNRVVTTGARYARLPASLQQSITFAFGRDLTGDPVNPRKFAWAPLNNRQITLSFRPATPADDQTLRTFFPSDLTDLSQAPTSIPAYLVNVIPELKVDGTVVMSGASMTLGETLNFTFDPEFVGRGAKNFSYSMPAGSLLAISVIGGTISPRAMSAASARIAATNAILTAHDPTQLSLLDRDQTVGDHFHAGLLQYYDEYVAYGYIQGLRQGAHHELAAGVGSYGFEPSVSSLFGVPRRIFGGGAVMNVPIVNIVGHEDGSGVRSRGYTLQLGLISSALEHAIPQRMFANASGGVEAISAVKALQKARQAGQRIFVLTPANQASIFPLLNLPAATLAEISAALSAGRNVVAHTNVVSAGGWSGAGYIAYDPETGSGTYKISGGQNGARIAIVVLIAAIIAFGYAFLAAPGFFLGLRLVITLYEFFHFTHELRESDPKDIPRASLAAVLSVLTAAFLPKIYHGEESEVLDLIVFFTLLGGGCIAGVYESCRVPGEE